MMASQTSIFKGAENVGTEPKIINSAGQEAVAPTLSIHHRSSLFKFFSKSHKFQRPNFRGKISANLTFSSCALICHQGDPGEEVAGGSVNGEYTLIDKVW